MKKKLKARVIAFYLPQFHPIPENDLWWGNGFTEWTNVAKAKPLFEGHYQPRLPADLGYYDLRVRETRQAQADLAKEYGVEAFCYWHYWFNGKQLLQRPFEEVVQMGEPDFPFCLGWANQTWSGIWHGAPDRVLIEQTYPGLDDYKKHFYALLAAFQDSRYLKINGKLVFVIYNPSDLPDVKIFTDLWQELACKENLPEFHFIAHMSKEPLSLGCLSCVDNAPFVNLNKLSENIRPIIEGTIPSVAEYEELVKYLSLYQLSDNEHPLIVPNWDNTPRSGSKGLVLNNSTPELFHEMVVDAIQKVEINYPLFEDRVIFLKAWNEWAEGNYMEPDTQFGCTYLDVLKQALSND